MMHYIEGAMIPLDETPQKELLAALLVPEELSKANAKLPYLVGYAHRFPYKAINEKYFTMWPIHPVPLFLEH